MKGHSVVTHDTRRDRYAGIDLERFSREMPPALFAAFKDFIGMIPGRPGLDVGALTRGELYEPEHEEDRACE